MPYVNIQLLPGTSAPERRLVVADVTRSLVTRLGKSPEHIHIVIQEIPADSWGYAGRLTSDRPARPARTTRRKSA